MLGRVLFPGFSCGLVWKGERVRERKLMEGGGKREG